MSIILKALKKVQEQEAGQRAGQAQGLPSADASSHATPPTRAAGKKSAQAGPGSNAFSPPKTERGRSGAHKSSAPPPVARQAFGSAPKALLGLLVVVGIAMVGWFASSLYRVNSGQASETPVVAETPAEAVEDTSSPSQSAALEPAATVSTPTPEAAVETVLRAEEQAESAAMDAAVAAAVVRPAESSGHAAPVMKEAEPEKRGRPEFKINAIAWKNKEPRAIVNMQSVYEGDTIEGATVLAIKRKMVFLEYEGETFEIRFGL